MDALQISQRRPNVILKQNPRGIFINSCNKDILSSWKGNVDLQYVINEIATVKCIIDRYAARADALHNICLATFAVTYDTLQSSTKTAETNNINTQEDIHKTENADTLTKWKLQKRLGVIRKKKQQAILHTRR